jgi:hypothetical protein
MFTNAKCKKLGFPRDRKLCQQIENAVNINAEANDDGDDGYDNGLGPADDTEPTGREQRTVFHQLCASRYK